MLLSIYTPDVYIHHIILYLPYTYTSYLYLSSHSLYIYAHAYPSYPYSGHLSGRVEAGPLIQPEDGPHREAGPRRHLGQVPTAG